VPTPTPSFKNTRLHIKHSSAPVSTSPLNSEFLQITDFNSKLEEKDARDGCETTLSSWTTLVALSVLTCTSALHCAARCPG